MVEVRCIIYGARRCEEVPIFRLKKSVLKLSAMAGTHLSKSMNSAGSSSEYLDQRIKYIHPHTATADSAKIRDI